jgi:hypothetical protein
LPWVSYDAEESFASFFIRGGNDGFTMYPKDSIYPEPFCILFHNISPLGTLNSHHHKINMAHMAHDRFLIFCDKKFKTSLDFYPFILISHITAPSSFAHGR